MTVVNDESSNVLFGVNLSTAATDFDPVRTARDAEELGFDLVSCTDHPCGAHASNETWTLLAWVAAQTAAIKIAPRVLAVPLRSPVLVAKMAETLHRLAGERLVLGLGAGGMDDEIAAVGGPRLVPADKIRAFGEAVEIIRGVWAEESFRFDGRFHRADGATITPRPDKGVIPIWMGAFGPAALRVTGRLADGWIPTLGHRPEQEFESMARTVREAAADAGRDPEQIRFVLNCRVELREEGADPNVLGGSPDRLVERLLRFAELGFTGFNFIVPDDDVVAQHELLAREVVPAVRAAVDRGAAIDV